MQIEPVLDHARPAYPTRRDFLAAGAAALASLGIPGCGGDADAAIQVAPIFPHGDGRGAMGCIVVSPPVFMSEEEAMQVIREELAKAGVKLGDELPLKEVTVEYEDPDAKWLQSVSDNWLGEPPTKVSQPAALAAVDPERKVGVEIITREDCSRFRGAVWSSVSSFDTKGLAKSTADCIREQGERDLRVGVFYDPMESWGFEESVAVQELPTEEAVDAPGSTKLPKRSVEPFDRVIDRAKERSEEQLRKQVRDFIAWLERTKS